MKVVPIAALGVSCVGLWVGLFAVGLLIDSIIAGVYITGGDPFSDGSPSQYVRFAGSVSLLAYLVGYDPTRLQDLLDGLPRLGKKT